MRIAEAFNNFFRFLSGPEPQVQARGRQQPIKVRQDNPVAAKQRKLAEKRRAKEGSWGETQFLQR